MSKKYSDARKAAFLTALAVSGNQSLSAERVKVSRSWVGLQRSSDAGFDAAVREAIAAAKVGLSKGMHSPHSAHSQHSPHSPHPPASRIPPSPAGGRGASKPPAGWGFLDGVELVVRGSNGRRTQIARARVGQWTPRVERRFLAALSATCNVKAACAEVGLAHSSAYAHRKRWLAFAGAWDAAICEGYMRIEAALIERGCNVFSNLDEVPLGPIPTMSAAQAIHLLHMHKNIARGIGGRPGKSWRQRPRTLDEMRDSILRKLEAIDSWRAVGDEQQAADQREIVARRPQGGG